MNKYMENKRYLVNSILMLVGTICFGIVTYGYFYEKKYILGFLCLVPAVCDLISFVINVVKYKNSK